MKGNLHLIHKCIILIYCLLPLCMQGQRIIHVDVDSLTCLWDSVQIRVGYDWNNEVVIENPRTSVSHPGRVFLPDGTPCGTLGCSYRSPATFSGFLPGATIQSVEDIKFVRLNIEHSWIGDIYIGITCPNGQKVSLMNYSDNGSSNCSSSIPSNHRGWLVDNHVPSNTHLGDAYDFHSYTNGCDSTDPANQPGVGWNYCWSNNSTEGYVYANAWVGDTGNIYSSGHAHGGILDSSNVAAGTNFYRPDQHFSALIGCPLNGDWYIEVMDGWSGDNGYIFDWEMSLSDALVDRRDSTLTISMTGNEVTRTSDTSFLVSAPAGSTHDTTVTYTITVQTSDGTVYDTTAMVHFEMEPRLIFRDSLCMGDTFWVDTMAITETRKEIDTVYLPSGCPIVREFDLVFSPSYHFYDTALFCYSDFYTWHDIIFPTPGDYDFTAQTAGGCDSVWHVTIWGRDSGFVATPLISDDGTNYYSDTMLAGCRPMTVWLQSGTPHAAHSWWNWGDTTWYEGDEITHVFDSIGIFPIAYMTESEHGCRDTAEIPSVWVFGRPEAGFIWTPETPAMSHPTVQFFSQSTPYGDSTQENLASMSYRWNIQTSGGYDSIWGENPVYTWSAEGGNVFGDFTVLLTAIQTYTGPYGEPTECEDTASAIITIVNDWLQFPNLVTPNGDGTNDTWKVVNMLECGLYSMNELWIYNKWGTLVYHVKNIAEESDFWDPEKTHSPDGTYFYRFSAKSMFGIVRTNGMIEVVR